MTLFKKITPQDAKPRMERVCWGMRGCGPARATRRASDRCGPPAGPGVAYRDCPALSLISRVPQAAVFVDIPPSPVDWLRWPPRHPRQRVPAPVRRCLSAVPAGCCSLPVPPCVPQPPALGHPWLPPCRTRGLWRGALESV